MTGTTPFATPITISASDPSVTRVTVDDYRSRTNAHAHLYRRRFGPTINSVDRVDLTIGRDVFRFRFRSTAYLYVANSNAPFGTPPTGRREHRRLHLWATSIAAGTRYHRRDDRIFDPDYARRFRRTSDVLDNGSRLHDLSTRPSKSSQARRTGKCRGDAADHELANGRSADSKRPARDDLRSHRSVFVHLVRQRLLRHLRRDERHPRPSLPRLRTSAEPGPAARLR